MDARNDGLIERLEKLEKAVEEIQLAIADPRSNRPAPALDPGAKTGITPPPSPPAPVRKELSPKPATHKKPPPGYGDLFKSESLLKLVGISLILFGIAFVFKYSIDQGWLTETVRVCFGLLLGTLLFALGVRLHTPRRSFSLVLLGGGIAAYYITGYAAFQFYALISHPIAFSFMIAVTLLSFFVSLRQRETTLSLIGTAGGLGTPFLLYTGAGNIPGLVGYTCLILAGTSAIYLARGWRSLLWTSVIGGWLVFSTASIAVVDAPFTDTTDRWALQAGILFGLLAFWLLPVLREVLSAANPSHWPRPSLESIAWDIPDRTIKLIHRHPHMLSVSTPLIAIAASAPLWDLSPRTWGWVILAGAALFALVAWNLKRFTGEKALAYTQGMVALLLATMALCLLLEGDVLFFTLAAEATILHFLSHRLEDRGISISGHALFIGVGIALTIRLLAWPPEGLPVFTIHSLTDLAVIGLALAASFRLQTSAERLVYRLLVHAGILGLSLRELSTLDGGQGYVTVVWGIYAIALLLAGLRLGIDQLLMVAMGTLLLVVGKLFLVDLARLEAIWRILLFLGFGGIFLVLSYFYQSLWKKGTPPSPEAE